MHLQSAVLSELTGFPSFYSLLGHFYHLATNLEREMPGSSALFSQACQWWLHSLTAATVLQLRGRHFWRVGRKEAMGMLLIVFTLELVSKKASLLVRKHTYVFFWGMVIVRGGALGGEGCNPWRVMEALGYVLYFLRVCSSNRPGLPLIPPHGHPQPQGSNAQCVQGKLMSARKMLFCLHQLRLCLPVDSPLLWPTLFLWFCVRKMGLNSSSII